MKFSRTCLVVAATFALAGCSQYASVSKREPRYRPVASVEGPLATVSHSIQKGLRTREPLAALGDLLSAADLASKRLAENPKDTEAREAYNFAVGRVLARIQDSNLDPWSTPLRVPAAGGEYVLTHKRDPRPGWNPKLYDFTPADEFDVKGRYVSERQAKAGVGAPTVAIGRETNHNAHRDYTMERIYYGVTALIRFEGRRAVLEFADPLNVEFVTLNGRKHPLAADYTVPLAVLLSSTNTRKLELARLLRPAKYAETARISRLEPYHPGKTVVLVIHGLMDSPATWTPMINHLRADPEVRKKYQFWFYSYPSGYPFPYSAAILRRELDAVQKRFPLKQKMVVIGHSMGGCISRLLVTDTGESIWVDLFGKRPSEVNMPASSKAMLTEALIFRHRDEIGRVIFLSAPLRGADMAGGWVGRIGTMLVKSPQNLLKVGRDAMKFATFRAGDLKLDRIPNSVDTLASNNRFMRALQKVPLNPTIPYHVIVGDRGKGGNKDKTKPQMSDGFVPYWSSHLDEAKSELIIPSNHSTHQHKEAMSEVERILEASPR